MHSSAVSWVAVYSSIHPQSLSALVCCLVVGLCAEAVGCRDNGSDGVAGSGGTAGIGGAGGSGGVTFTDCINPSSDNRCECYPFFGGFSPSCGSGESCSLRFLTNSEGRVIGLPALDGSDGTKATKCVALAAQANSAGEPCSVLTESISADVNVRYDTCTPGLFCYGNRCAYMCDIQDDCYPYGCDLLDAEYPGGGPFGVCGTDKPD